MQIDTVIVSGNRILGEGELVGVVKNVTGGKYVYLIPKTSSIFYPKKDIIQGLLAYSARIKSVSVAKEGLKKSIITISERQPLYVW
jgi:cell division septal protein FtsQ